MKQRYKFVACITLCIGSYMIHGFETPKKAIFTRPITDLFFERLSLIYGSSVSLEELYDGSPLFATTAWGCRRAFQALFNETCSIVDEIDGEICIALPHVYYSMADRGGKHTTFWTRSEYVTVIDDAQAELFPEPIQHQDAVSLVNEYVLTLAMPWCDPITRISYSVGTRFMRLSAQDTSDYYAVRFYDFAREQARESFIPKKDAVVCTQGIAAERQQNFIALLRRWIYEGDGIIPYVWGGASLTHYLPQQQCTQICEKILGKLVAYWHHAESKAPHSGMDCSLMVLRAAHICGIPYFCKNSYTIARCLRPLQQGELVEPGDIIWYEGHVMVISDCERNLIIESVGYPFGFGLVHEVPISKRLAGIKTINDLVQEYYALGGLGSLDRHGVVARVIDNFTILKLSSAR